MNNNTIINNNYGRLQYHIFSSKFPWARERISSKFLDSLGTRHQKISPALPYNTIYTSFASLGPVQQIMLYLPQPVLQRQLENSTDLRLTVAKFQPLIFPTL